MSDNGEIVIENNKLITFRSDCNNKDMKILKHIALLIKRLMHQEAVSIIINNSLAII